MFSLYGPNWWGTESSKGYARVHVPLGGTKRIIRAPILTAKCSNLWSAISSWFTDRNPELRDPKILLDGNKSKGIYIYKTKIIFEWSEFQVQFYCNSLFDLEVLRETTCHLIFFICFAFNE